MSVLVTDSPPLLVVPRLEEC